jgi:energy-coupling factor transporter ATP-binding protein EcfA2
MARPRLSDDSPEYVALIPRDAFLRRYWSYEEGEHVTIIGATGSGKTFLGFQLLGATISKDLPGVVLVMKPRDATVTKWANKLNLKRVKSWPPPYVRRKVDAPRGWVLWPPLGDYDRDDETLRREFDRCFRESYTQAAGRNPEPRVIFADEVVGISKDLGLENGLKRLWMRGRSLGIGVWAATQRPFDAPLLAYQAPTHVFLGLEPDERNRQRLGEISGYDSALIRTIVDPAAGVMSKHQFLYLGRDEQTMAIVDR